MYEEQVAELLGRTGTIRICMKVARGVEVLEIFWGEEVFRFFCRFGWGWCFLKGRGVYLGGRGKKQAGQSGIRQRGRSRVGEWGGFLKWWTFRRLIVTSQGPGH